MTVIRRVVITAGLGSMLEMYDFAIYGMVVTTLGELYFPSTDSFVSTMSSAGVFASGFLARPLGSIFFGHLGDRIGRKKVLILTIALMALPSFLIAMVPTYQSIGYFAPILLVILRLLQGFAVGGEFAGAITFVAEYAKTSKRGFTTSWIFFFVNSGIVLASLLGALLSAILPHDDFTLWGWRILFLIGGLLALVGIYLRQQVDETHVFAHAKEEHRLIEYPFKDIFRTSFVAVLRGLGISWGVAVVVGVVLLYIPSYLTYLHVSITESLMLSMIQLVAVSLLIPLAGWISDRVGRKPLLLTGAMGFILFSYPFFILINHSSLLIKLLGLLGFSLFTACLLGAFGASLAELFPTRSRYTGVAFTYNVPFALFAGTAPLISLYLIHKTGTNLAPSFYVIISLIVVLIIIAGMKETVNKKL